MELERIIEACKSGDRNAFGFLYKQYYKKLLAICLYYVSDENIAKDILHDGFILIMSSIQTLHSADKVESWMCIIIKNLSIRYLKENNGSVISFSELNGFELSIEEDAENKQLNIPSYEELMKFVDELPNGYQKVFRLSVLEGLSHKEIAAQLNIAPHSSSSQLHRAKEQMKKILANHHFIWLVCIIIVVPFVIFVQKLMVVSTSKNNNRTIVQKINPPKSTDDAAINQKTAEENGVITGLLKKQEASIDNSAIATINTDTLKVDILVEPTNEKKDSTIVKEQYRQNNGYTFEPHKLIASNDNQWNIKFAYSGINNVCTDYNVLSSSGGIGSDEPGQSEIKEQNKHYMPLIVGVSFGKKISKRIGITAGLRYLYLKSKFEQTSKFKATNTLQELHYLGLPFGINYNIYTNRNFNVYSNMGFALDIPIKSTSMSCVTDTNGQLNTSTSELSPLLQWSIFSGIGLQYNLTPHVGLYIEPQLNYYFNNGDHISNMLKDKPMNVDIPLGIRVTW